MEDVNNNNNMMKFKPTDWIVLGGLLIVILLVISHSVTHNHFRNNAGKWAQPSIEQKNIISTSDLASLPENTITVDLSGRSRIMNVKQIPAGDILEKPNFKYLHNHKGNIVLVSEDPAVSARIWMLLSQMGVKNLYILSEN